MDFSSNIKPKSVELEAVVTRADGTVENLGTIATWHKNPVINLYRLLKLKSRIRKQKQAEKARRHHN
jgi:hypothetical protein